MARFSYTLGSQLAHGRYDSSRWSCGIPNVDTNNWYALFAPAKTPATTITALNDAVRRALATPALQAKLLNTDAEPAPSTPAELAALLERDTKKWAKLIRDKKIKAE